MMDGAATTPGHPAAVASPPRAAFRNSNAAFRVSCRRLVALQVCVHAFVQGDRPCVAKKPHAATPRKPESEPRCQRSTFQSLANSPFARTASVRVAQAFRLLFRVSGGHPPTRNGLWRAAEAIATVKPTRPLAEHGAQWLMGNARSVPATPDCSGSETRNSRTEASATRPLAPTFSRCKEPECAPATLRRDGSSGENAGSRPGFTPCQAGNRAGVRRSPRSRRDAVRGKSCAPR